MGGYKPRIARRTQLKNCHTLTSIDSCRTDHTVRILLFCLTRIFLYTCTQKKLPLPQFCPYPCYTNNHRVSLIPLLLERLVDSQYKSLRPALRMCLRDIGCTWKHQPPCTCRRRSWCSRKHQPPRTCRRRSPRTLNLPVNSCLRCRGCRSWRLTQNKTRRRTRCTRHFQSWLCTCSRGR